MVGLDWELDPESCVPPFEDQATAECRDSGYDTVLDKYISRTNYPLASGSARHRDLYQLNPFPDFTTGTYLYLQYKYALQS